MDLHVKEDAVLISMPSKSHFNGVSHLNLPSFNILHHFLTNSSSSLRLPSCLIKPLKSPSPTGMAKFQEHCGWQGLGGDLPQNHTDSLHLREQTKPR
ncbi:hypothetical protein PoB_000484200 [Plakobranchus ocellatus]|uniref:Uncharacterized protein n=1 Tax=Plakobranchus ocellatus TaxID=259542 RepID=A0AAV3Y890_9GAST|nr:hypothetical protein PoB_000484200 [Plakobranchus ocellatus]